jgi:host factor-I protein
MVETHRNDPCGRDKTSPNIQKNFLNTVRKERALVTVFLMGGARLTGKIRSFEKYSVLQDSNHSDQLIFKHAITSVVPARSSLGRTSAAPAPATVPALVLPPTRTPED